MMHGRLPRGAALAGALLATWLVGTTAADAGVGQLVAVGVPDNTISGLSDVDSTFGATSGDITTDILATAISPGFGRGRGSATASAGRFGSVGLVGRFFGGIDRGTTGVGASAAIISDEPVNLTGGSARASSRFIIDGGRLRADGARNLLMGYRLSLSAANLGPVGATSTLSELSVRADAAFSNPSFRDVFFSSGQVSFDAAGVATFQLVGRDIGASFDSLTNTLDIPLSTQTAELGVLLSGDRLLIEYGLSIFADLLLPFETGVAEGIFMSFSDPLSLSSNPAFGTIGLVPSVVPLPPALVLVASGLGGLALLSRRQARSRP